MESKVPTAEETQQPPESVHAPIQSAWCFSLSSAAAATALSAAAAALALAALALAALDALALAFAAVAFAAAALSGQVDGSSCRFVVRSREGHAKHLVLSALALPRALAEPVPPAKAPSRVIQTGQESSHT